MAITETGAGHVFSSDDVCRVVGERVRDARRALGLTMAQFAEVSEISLGMVSKIEHGQTSPSLSTLTRLAHAAQVPITAFFGGLDEEHDVVIVRGQTRLIDGSRVEVRTATGEKPTSVAAGGDGE